MGVDGITIDGDVGELVFMHFLVLLDLRKLCFCMLCVFLHSPFKS